jgi:hypothetical protein
MTEEDIKFKTGEWTETIIILEPSGTAPPKYGERVYRFYAAMTLSVIMPKRGWQLIKKTKNYVYLKTPDEQHSPPFHITIKIPSQQQALEIAKSCYDDEKSWMGQLGEWPTWYIHKQKNESYEITRDRESGEIVKKLAHVFAPKSWLQIGQFGVWEIRLDKTEDGFSFSESGVFKTPEIKQENDLVLLEGQEFSIEQSRYERNPIARKLCIEHFGARCQVCCFNFSLVYGQIGHGFIHVHHLIPIYEQGGEYEVNPITDLIPLCANCHAMVHRRYPSLTIAELKSYLTGNVKDPI